MRDELQVRILRLPALAAVLAVASTARADDAADTATARALGVEGVTLADTGKCREAVEKLERAEKLHHAPTTATRLGECEIEIGRIVAGTERLQRVVREPLPANAHPAFAAAVARAQKALDAALPRIATLKLAITGAPHPIVTIDGDALPDAALDVPRRIDPGAHAVEVRAPGYRPVSATAVLNAGELKSLSLELVPDPDAKVAEAPSAPPAPRPERPSKAPALVAFGVGAVGLGLGIAGALAVDSRTRTLDQRCDANRVCPSDAGSDLDQAKTWATVSTAGFITGGVGAVTGLVLLLVSRSPSSTVRPSVGAGSVGLHGVF